MNVNDPYQEEPTPKLVNRAIATARTALPVAWTTLGIQAIEAVSDIDLTPDQEVIAALVIGAVTAVVYNVFRELEARWPVIGRIFFGVSRAPKY